MEGEPINPEITREAAGSERSLGGETESPKSPEENLTPEQQENIQIMEGVKEKYPLAFESTKDKKGREVMVIRESDHQGPSFHILTQEGVFIFKKSERESMWYDADFTPLLDLSEKLGPGFGMGKDEEWEIVTGGNIEKAKRLDLHVDKYRQLISEHLKRSQEYWEERVQKSKRPTPEDIVSQL